MVVRELLTKLGFKVDRIQIKEYEKSLENVRSRMESLSKKTEDIGKKLSFKFSLPIAAMGYAFAKAAVDAEDAHERMTVVFSGVAGAADAATKRIASGFSMSTAQSEGLLSNTGNLLQSMGFAQGASLKMSEAIITTGADVAAFLDLEGGAAAATDKITRALSGQTMGLKDLGVSIKEEDISARIAQNSMNGMTFATEKQAKAFAVLQLIQQQSARANGSFAKQSGDLDMRIQKLRARVADLAVTYGKILIPPLTLLVNKLISVAEWFSELSPTTQKLIVYTMALLAAIGPLIYGFSIFAGMMAKVTGFIPLLIKGFLSLGNGAALATLKMVAGPALIIAAFAALFLLFDDLLAYTQGRKSVFGTILEKVPEIGKAISGIFEPILQPIMNIIAMLSGGFGSWKDVLFEIGKLIINMILTPLRMALGLVGSVAGVLGKLTGAKFFEGIAGGALGAQNFLQVNPNATAPSLAPGSSQAALSGMARGTTQVQAPITVNVPPGTPPDQVGPAVRQGTDDAFQQIMRETYRQSSPAVEF